MNVSDKRDYKMLKGQGRNYFFNMKKAKSGNGYLKITESRWDKESNNGKKFSLVVFKEDLVGFAKTLNEAIPLVA